MEIHYNYLEECDLCGETTYVHNFSIRGIGVMPICLKCKINELGDYRICSCCETLVAMNELVRDNYGTEMCRDCFNGLDKKILVESISKYNFKPEPVFFGSSERFFGIELEIENEKTTHKSRLNEIALGVISDELYCKYDSSIKDGFEMVTHPCSLSYHLNEMGWERKLNHLVENGMVKLDNAGLHLHVNRSSLGEGDDFYYALYNILMIMQSKYNIVVFNFGRRKYYSAIEYCQKTEVKAVIDREKAVEIAKDFESWQKQKHDNRYFCINCQNEKTVEFRCFQATTDSEILFDTIKLIDNICEFAKNHTPKECHFVKLEELIG